MTIFSGVVAILSPKLVTRLRSDIAIFSELQARCGVTCTQTAEDICMIQGDWDAVKKVYDMLEGAEPPTKGAKPGIFEPSSNYFDTLGRSHNTSTTSTNDSSLVNGMQVTALKERSTEPQESIQIVAAWGNFKEESITRLQEEGSLIQGTEDVVYPSYGTEMYPLPYSYTENHANSVSESMDTNENDAETNENEERDANSPVPNGVGKTKGNKSPSTYAKYEVLQLTDSTAAASNESKKGNKPIKIKLLAKKVTRPARKRLAPMKRSKTARKSTTAKPPSAMESKPAPLPIIKQEVDDSGEGGGPITCNLCQKTMAVMEQMEVHNWVYHNVKFVNGKLECPYCDNGYISKHSLEEHMYKHVGTRPFACKLCSMSFNHRKSLRRHLLLHDNARRYRCEQCNMTFLRKDSLESHTKTHFEEKVKLHKCSRCEERFVSIYALKKHRVQHQCVKKGTVQPQKSTATKKKKVPTATLR